MTQPREPTSSFPTTRREQWVERERRAPELVSNFVEFEYEVYEDEDTRTRGERPFLIVNHKAQFREDHQRVVMGPNGGLMHVEAGEILAENLEAFLATDNRAYLFDPLDGRWHRRRGSQVLDGFPFAAAPWAGGQIERLDPQWVRETFTLPIADQVADAKKRRLDRAEAKRESGDKRGTTLNLQVGAAADDGEISSGNTSNFTSGSFAGQLRIGGTNVGIGEWEDQWWRFTGVSGLSGATIDSAQMQIYSAFGGSPGGGGASQTVYANYSATPTAPTSRTDYLAKTKTTASDNTGALNFPAAGAFTNFCEVSSSLQELADNHDSSAIQLLSITDDRTDINKYEWASDYNTSSAQAARLDIDYTAGTTETPQTLSVTVTGTATMARVKHAVKTVAVTATATAAISRSVAKALTLTTTGTATVAKSVAKTLSVASAITASLAAARQYVRVLSATSTATATMSRSVGKLVAASAAATASMVRSVGKSLALTATGTASVAKSVSKTLGVTASGTATLAATQVILLTLTVAVSSTAAMARSVGKTLTANAAGTVTLAATKTLQQALSATVTGTASMVRSVGKRLSVTATGAATLTRASTFGRSLSVTATATASMVRFTGKLLAVTATGTVSMVRQIGKGLAVVASSTASLVAQFIAGGGTVFPQALSVTVTGTTTMARAIIYSRVLSVAVTGSVTMVRSVGKALAVTAGATSAITRSIGKTISLTVTTTPTVVRSVVKTLTITATATASMVRSVGKTLAATASATAELVAVFVPGGAVFNQILSVTVTATASMVRVVTAILRFAPGGPFPPLRRLFLHEIWESIIRERDGD